MPKHRHPDVRLVVHGHFYQPPRESPWTDEVPVEPSAHPYHDWNERITAECYRPNTASRVLDAYGRIRSIVDNFEHISFNVGPTLFAWLDRKHPDVCTRIQAADRKSVATRGGHGNAIAQAYNHAILPLANERDRRTQVIWGLREFQHRFRRPAEGMWLAETAIHAGTVETLIDCGVRFTVLSPYQAWRARPIAGGSWEDVSGGRVDPKRAYRILSSRPGPGGERRFLDVFFYDGPISRDVSFEHLLRSSDTLAERLAIAVQPDASRPQAVSLAVDGETFGHHEPFGDMCISALVTEKARPRGFHLTNYAQFLADFPPEFEVELQPGDHGEGTAWSCSHGVGRWVRDCGCSTGALPGWNQAWRGPLRLAFDGLRNAVAALFEKHGRELFHDPWAARDDYVDLVVRPDEAAVAEAFFARHLRSEADHATRVQARKLLEAQRHAMAMYTSCGWFFADVTGIETVQCIRYAARCAQMMQEFASEDLEGRLLAGLEQVRSNDGRNTGATIYRNWIQPEVRTARRAASAYAIFRLLEVASDTHHVYGFSLRDTAEEAFDLLGQRARRGHVWLRDRRTGEETELSYLALEYSPRNLRCFLVAADADEHDRLRQQVSSLRAPLERPDLERALTNIYGGPPLGITDLLPDERRRIAERLAGERVAGLRHKYREIFHENRHLLQDFADMRLELPSEIRVPCEFTLQADLEECTGKLVSPFQPVVLQELDDLMGLAARLGLRVDSEPVAHLLGEHLLAEIEQLHRDRSPRHFEAASNLLAAAERLGLQMRRAEAEESLWEFLQKEVLPQAQRAAELEPAELDFAEAALRFAERLNFVIDDWRAWVAQPRATGTAS
jgi:alpha-amylase/alpha-mannosidase (GH57 family)